MKILLAAILAATSAIQTAPAERNLPAPLPDFKTPEQLAVWRREMKNKACAAETTANAPASRFYTGRPYIQETGTYGFKFRQYDPDLNRWTTTDPSGFPDGLNNAAYAPVPTSSFDFQGLKAVLWLYAFSDPMAPQNGPDSATWAAFQNDYESIKSNLIDQDGCQNPSPEYLSDGDYFEVASFSNVNQLSDFTPDKIYLMAHGLNIGTPQNPQFDNPNKYVIGGTAYTEGSIKNFNSAIEMVLGCGSALMGGVVTTSNSVAWSFAHATADYLRE